MIKKYLDKTSERSLKGSVPQKMLHLAGTYGTRLYKTRIWFKAKATAHRQALITLWFVKNYRSVKIVFERN